MIRKFTEFQDHDVYSKKIGMISEDHGMPDLFGGDDCKVMIRILPNEFTTHQVFNRLAGKPFIPQHVGGKFAGVKLKTPITTVSPKSTIKTFQTLRKLNHEPLEKGTLYFTTPKITDQFQVAARGGNLIGARQLISGKPVHLDMSRHPAAVDFQQITKDLTESLGSEYLRFRVGSTQNGPILLAMENFSLKKPELIDLYFDVYETYLNKIPAWYKQKVKTEQLTSYLNEYINREEVLKKCPYIL